MLVALFGREVPEVTGDRADFEALFDRFETLAVLSCAHPAVASTAAMKLNPSSGEPGPLSDSSFYRPFTADFRCRRSLRGYPLKVVAYFGITVDVSVERHGSFATRGACKQSSSVQHLVPDSYSTQCTVEV